jgi:hypothetical protein
MRLVLVAAACVAVGGCVPRVAFDHAYANQQQMLQDRFQCLQVSSGYVAVGFEAAVLTNNAMLLNCMAAKGYYRNDIGGRLEVPAQLIARTY